MHSTQIQMNTKMPFIDESRKCVYSLNCIQFLHPIDCLESADMSRQPSTHLTKEFWRTKTRLNSFYEIITIIIVNRNKHLSLFSGRSNWIITIIRRYHWIKCALWPVIRTEIRLWIRFPWKWRRRRSIWTNNI